VRADDLAYILYTSGSTGRPKGVAMRHGALAALIRWQIAINTPGNRSGTGRTLQATSPSFDVSFQEIVSTWAAGGCLVLISEEERRDPAALLARLRAERIERLFLPFVGLQQLAEAARGTALATLPGTLREVVTAGEQLRITPAVAELFARLPGARLHNHYGPSETHVVTSFTLEGDPASWPALPPIGRPIAGARAHVADLDGRPAAVGAPGELLLGGDLLARGYLDRPELTAERFVPDPFATEPAQEPGARLYRTGDLARWRPDGELEFLGRIDAQVKIRGHRVEPGEIEAMLEAHPALAAAAVVVQEQRPGDLSGHKRLVAWVVPADGKATEEIDPRELRRHLAERLPDPMVPSVIVSAPSLPLTPSGKVDRRALARQDPGHPGAVDAGFVAPRTSTEEILASIWAEVLGVERVGADSNFFELGGHSLLATQVVSRVRDACGVELPLRVVFEAPTLAGFTERIERELERGDDATPLSTGVISFEGRDRVAPLSFGQHRLWFLERLVPGSPVFNLPLALRLDGRLHLIPLSGAFAAIVRRHEALRTVFAEEAGQPVQIVLDPPPTPWFPLPLVDLTALPPELARSEADRRGREEGRRPFDLTRGPLLRALLLRLAPEEHVAVVTLHHIASDAWSLGVLVREIGGFYTALSAGKPSALPALPVQYPDYAVWQRGAAHDERMKAQLRWWKQALAGAPQILELPADRPRPPVQSRDGAQRAILLPPDLAAGVWQLGRREGTTLFMTLLATFVGLLSRLTGAEDLLVGSPVAGRTRPELEPLIGFFVNDLVLRGDAGGDPLFRHLLSRVRTTALGALAHQEVPFERLVEEIVEERSLSHHPLVQVAFAFQNTPSGQLVLPGLSLSPWDLDSGTAKLDLLLSLSEERGSARIDGVWEYSTELFDLATIDRMSGHFLTLLAGAVEEPGRRLSELPLLTAAEQAELAAWNSLGRGPEEPRETLLHDLFLAWAERTPDAPAVIQKVIQKVIQEERVLSYGELRAAAERLARRLRALGVGPEVRVAVCLDETIERVVAILGVLRAGGAWVPVDPAYPPERVARMLEDSAAAVLLTREALLPALPPSAATPLCVDGDGGSAVEADLPERPADPDNLAFVMYTSGSTGQPNGVMIRHRSVVRFVEHAVRSFPLGPGRRSLQMVSFSFDPSVLETWTALASGAAICIARREARFSGEVLAEELRRYGANYATIIPSLLAQLPVRPEDFPALDTVSIGGEGCPAEVADRWADRLRLVNCYGPTEATVHVAEAVCVGRQHRVPPIGRPVAGARLWVLDRNLLPLPVGVPGALWIAGPGLARGYLNRPDLTAERFLPDPLGGEPGARLYHSGDVARLLPDGNLELLGRLDHQVKVRGLRIELGEIEAVLRTHPGLSECAVVGEGVAADRRLVAFAVPRQEPHPEKMPPQQLPEPAALRAFLRDRLPESMIPSAFVLLETLPRSPVGKVDRGALERLAAGAAVARETGRTPPSTPTERALAEIWADVLGLASPEAVSTRDGFFELGGHSLLVARVISRVRERWGIELPLLALFEAPVLEEMARRIDDVLEIPEIPRERAPRGAAPLPPIPPLVPVHPPVGPGEIRRAPLSFAQRRLWFLDQLRPGSAAYNLPLAVRLTGALDVPALAGSLEAIVRRHETLRTTFEAVQGEPWQVISGESGVVLPLLDLSALPAGPRESEAARFVSNEALGPFDLERGPLFRARLLCLRADEHVLVSVMHHVIGDGWSLGVLVQELGELYPALRNRKPSTLPPLPVQYADFAVWQNGWLQGDALDALLAWWRRELEGAPQVLDLPTDRPRPPVHTFRGAEEPFALPAGLAGAVRDLGRREGATPFMVFLAGLEALLGRWSGQRDLLIGSPVASRTRLEVEPLIGFFVNTLVHRGRLEGVPSFRGLIGRVRAAALEAFAHQDLPFELLVDELGVERTRRRTPLYQVLFALQNAPAGPLRLPDLVLDGVPMAAGTAKTDLLLSLADAPDGAELQGTWQYATDLFDAATAGRLARGFAALLAGAVADPEACLGDLPLLPEAERLEVLTGWNRTAVSYPRESSLGTLFAEVAARTPDAVAVTGDTSLTYAGLERLSARVAHRLRARGAGLEERIAVAAERSPGLIAALLGILRAGGAYLPLDPASPPGRLAWMMEDAGARLLIADRRMLDLLPAAALPPGLETVALDELLADGGLETELPALPDIPAEALAYVMYTSGSTGTPKGVAVTHRNVVRLVRGADSSRMGAEMGADQVWLQMAPVSFDAATLEIWAPLLNGGRLALMPPGRAGLDDVAEALARHAVTSLWLTAGLFHQMVDHRLEALRPLRQLLAGGDVVSASHARRVLEALPGLTLIDGYGPTEGTTFTCCHRMRATADIGAAVPIGRPIANARVYVLDVLDGELRPVPPGVAGELFAGGDGLARGYLGRPELTADRFVPDLFSGLPGERLYRTGDRVRWRNDATLEFLGRLDQQVKIRGFRVEPEEVEAVLVQHPAVRQAIVLAREGKEGAADRTLAAWVVPGDPERRPSAAELQGFLRERLPEAMIPAAWAFLEALPLTPNGKVDRRALPDPEEARAGDSSSGEPRTPLERDLVELAADVLGLEKVGIHDNFFNLGGHSLLATQLAARLNDQLGCEVSLHLLFDATDFADLAEKITEQELEQVDEADLASLLEEIDGLSPEEMRELLAKGSERDQLEKE
jgi:amino acid adenylation domain-containing protein